MIKLTTQDIAYNLINASGLTIDNFDIVELYIKNN